MAAYGAASVAPTLPMFRARIDSAWRWLVFAALLLAGATVREGTGSALQMAAVWLPTGVGIAGVYILGPWSACIVALATFAQRLLLGYHAGVAAGAAVGSACEALIGAWVLRRLRVDRSFWRLRDVGGVVVAAAVAPFGSIACSGLARMLVWDRAMPFYSGWDGWWRMNALAAMMVLPAALSWSSLPRENVTTRRIRGAAGGAVAVAGVMLVLLWLVPQGVAGVLWLDLVLVGTAMWVAARFGMRGATLASLVAGMVLVVATARGVGPFVGVAPADRHVTLQLFALSLVALPSMFAAMLAERQAADAAARRTEALLASINRNVQDGLFRLDAGLRLVYANVALGRMFVDGPPGRTAEGPLEDTVASEARRTGLVEMLARRGQVHGVEVRFERADGTPFWGLVSCTAVRDADGAVSHYDGAIADITARKVLEEHVRQSQKLEAVGRLAGGVAHDFNNLLTVILGYAEGLRETARPGDPALQSVEAIGGAATRAAALTHQLLAYSRRQVLAPQVLDASDVVAQMAGMLERIIGEHIRLVVQRSPVACWVRVDRAQLEQVLLNLGTNARDAMRNGGLLTLATSLDTIDERTATTHPDRIAGPCVLIRVRDTGSGMETAVLAQAFDPFFTTKKPGSGSGLGLATVYGIVKQSGGSVWLESTPGEGTTACIALPRSSPPPALEAELPAPLVATVRAARVLVVEDEPAVLALVTRTLSSRGFAVVSAADGQRGLDVAQRGERCVDLVVADLVMPGMDGRELARRLRLKWPRLPVLFVSGYTDAAAAGESFRGPTDAFLAKPFTPATLLARVDALLSLPVAQGGAPASAHVSPPTPQ